jgi:BirA family biotin operon repressor/biotin-[acetyl-CoA-carboxylase] ligase
VQARDCSFRLAELRQAIKPIRLHWFPTVGSTNDQAARMRRRGALFAPAMVLTGRQTAGRGRGQHTWWSNRGVLTVTFAFPVEEHVAPHQLPLLAGLAVRDAAASLLPASVDVKLKWPNDLQIGARKLAGLLCERVDKADLVGLGLNVNVSSREVPAELRDRVVSLAEAAGRDLDLTDVLVAIARQLHRTLAYRDEQSFAQLLRRYDEHHALIGRRVSIAAVPGEVPITGKCEGLDAMGRLLVRDRKAVRRVIAGEVKVL